MKRAIFTSLCLAVLFTACKKEDIQLQDESATISLANQQNVYVSDWESVPSNSWQNTSNADGKLVFGYNRATPQLTMDIMNKGVIMVYAKGYSFGQMADTKPMGLPFNFFMPDERVISPNAWQFDKGLATVNVFLKMDPIVKSTFQQEQGTIKFRYVVIPDSYFTAKNITAVNLNRMSYIEVMTMLKVNP